MYITKTFFDTSTSKTILQQMAEWLNKQDGPEVIHVHDDGYKAEVLVKVREARKVSDIS